MLEVAKRKYHTVTIDPTCYVGTLASNEVLFNPIAITGACRKGGSARLMSIVVLDTDDTLKGISLFFMQVSKDLGTLGSIVSISNANMKLAKPLGAVDTNTQYTNWSGDYVAGGISTNTNFDLVVQSDADDNSTGDIYVGALATGASTFTASGQRIIFGFEMQ